MKIDQENFEQLVNRAMVNDNFTHMRAVIEKELLHYDILFALEKAGLLDSLVCQGGTSLRLCYGGNRFSEDLDFAGGKDFSSAMLMKMKACIENYVGARYGLDVIMKEPKKLKENVKYAELKIDKWQIAVVTAPGRKDMPKQKIKVEVANIPAYTKVPRSLQLNYDFLPDGYSDMLVLTETMDEVMADKLVSLPATQRYVRNRDIWDLAWLKQQGASVKADLVFKKIQDYKIEAFSGMLDTMIARIPEIIEGESFRSEMKRFTPADVYERTLAKDKFSLYLRNTVIELLQEVKLQLFSEGADANTFKM